MSDETRFSTATAEEQAEQPHHPKHRRDDVPVDADPTPSESAGYPAPSEFEGPELSEFGENPDTELAG